MDGEESPDIFDFFKRVVIIMGIQLSIFYTCLIIYHFLIFKPKLAREVEKLKVDREKLISISAHMEMERLSPARTQEESDIEAEKTQTSVIQSPIKNEKKTKRRILNRDSLAAEKTQPEDSPNSIADLPLATQSSFSAAHTPPTRPISPMLHDPKGTITCNDSLRENDQAIFSAFERNPDDINTAKDLN